MRFTESPTHFQAHFSTKVKFTLFIGDTEKFSLPQKKNEILTVMKSYYYKTGERKLFRRIFF